MIITRAPLRISFAGGGTDLPIFYREFGGSVVSSTINKYVYIELHPFFYKDRLQLKYSQIENINRYEDINHRLFREILKTNNVMGKELSCTADLPAGTGMGSSAAFSVALLKAIDTEKGVFRSKSIIAQEACKYEIDVLKMPVGKQDQYASSYGGLNFIKFNEDETVEIEPVILKKDNKIMLDENLILFYTGIIRNSEDVLKDQIINYKKSLNNQKKLMEIGNLSKELRKELLNNNIDAVGHYLNMNWILKREMSTKISSSKINDIYDHAIKNRASGGKLLGAGGGGFFMFYCKKECQGKLKKALNDYKVEPFNLENEGVKVIFGEK